jgi:exodeoxyribonuclease VII small subunit
MAEMKFEEALKGLEKIVEELESGKFSLDDSLKKYEQGIKLSRFCHKILQAAQKKIQVLTKKGAGWELKPFAGADEE